MSSFILQNYKSAITFKPTILEKLKLYLQSMNIQIWLQNELSFTPLKEVRAVASFQLSIFLLLVLLIVLFCICINYMRLNLYYVLFSTSYFLLFCFIKQSILLDDTNSIFQAYRQFSQTHFSFLKTLQSTIFLIQLKYVYCL